MLSEILSSSRTKATVLRYCFVFQNNLSTGFGFQKEKNRMNRFAVLVKIKHVFNASWSFVSAFQKSVYFFLECN